MENSISDGGGGKPQPGASSAPFQTFFRRSDERSVGHGGDKRPNRLSSVPRTAEHHASVTLALGRNDSRHHAKSNFMTLLPARNMKIKAPSFTSTSLVQRRLHEEAES